MEIQKIFSLKTAIKLKDRGNEILFTETNKKYPKYRVFCFLKNDKLLKDWKDL